MSMLNASVPGLLELMETFDIRLLWHHSLSAVNAPDHKRLTDRIVEGNEPLDILCLEGTILRGPGGTGGYDLFLGQPKKNWVAKLAAKARYVIAVGTCASFGGIGATGKVEGTGAQFLRWKKGGFLGESFKATSGLPVINLPGCPCHPEVLSGTLMAIAMEKTIRSSWFSLAPGGIFLLWCFSMPFRRSLREL